MRINITTQRIYLNNMHDLIHKVHCLTQCKWLIKGRGYDYQFCTLMNTNNNLPPPQSQVGKWDWCSGSKIPLGTWVPQTFNFIIYSRGFFIVLSTLPSSGIESIPLQPPTGIIEVGCKKMVTPKSRKLSYPEIKNRGLLTGFLPKLFTLL